MLWTLTFPSLQNKCIIVAKLLENKAKQKENLSASNSTQSCECVLAVALCECVCLAQQTYSSVTRS